MSFKKRSDKQGVSPLIATVIIIGFTIAIGAVIMTWGGGFVKSTTENTGEKALKQIDSLSGVDIKIGRASVNGNVLSFSAVNNGERDVKSFIVKVTGTDGSSTSSKTGEGIAALQGKSFSVVLNDAITEAYKIELLPVIEMDEEEYVSTSGFDTKYVGTDTGAVLSYNFDDGTATDLTGHGNNGVVKSGETTFSSTEGHRGTGAFVFNGLHVSGAACTIKATKNLVNTSLPWTFSFWFNRTATGTTAYLVDIPKDDSAGWAGPVMALRFATSNPNQAIIDSKYYDGTAVSSSVVSSLQYGKWYHIVGQYDGSNFKIYIDGNLKVTTPLIKPLWDAGSGITKGSFGINHLVGGQTAKFIGIIDDVLVFNRALNADEIKALYDSTKV